MTTTPDGLEILPFTLKAPWFQAVGARQLNNGKWRAYIFEETSPNNPKYCSWKYRAYRPLDDYLVEAPSLEALIELVKGYPYFDYKKEDSTNVKNLIQPKGTKSS